ncbi:cryptochrome/photolyase family protein [Burkholderia multivorans]|uniref:cryptochrome/photolyase family protein n=1 Tax=Burkholderia multivorans TaxID=87883 RepID=UPI001C2246A6|nr:deoxyribodipyrimidine photo-lyase [Burkholderia multivorans]MBU9487020.1 DNA photolyase family protein [Burkholderia multivorans]
MSVAIVLFRRDLRLSDHPALSAACARHDAVLPVYVHAPHEDAAWAPGAANRWWLHHSLTSLDRALRQQGGQLHVMEGDPTIAVPMLARAVGAQAVHWTRRYEPAAIACDTALKTTLRAEGIAAHSHPGALWQEPWALATEAGQPYRVFTPFWRKLRTSLSDCHPLPAARPRRWLTADGSIPIDAIGLLPPIRWDAGLAEAWRPGEAGAWERLEQFVDEALAEYGDARDAPARMGTSRLSAHLHFGEITPTQILRMLQERVARTSDSDRPDLEPFLRELGWREFAHHLLYHFPHTTDANFDARFDTFAWAPDDSEQLARWQQARTGIPLVDAGMRQLWQTGWMHNRVRMAVASFLTKNLRQHWRHGARWFWDTLVDADLANNTLGWQWVAGCGADAAPYFRVFNPYLQAARFDPDAAYLKRWLPELSRLPADVLHRPWKHPAALAACGYPAPMIDLAASREAALAAYARLPKSRGNPS